MMSLKCKYRNPLDTSASFGQDRQDLWLKVEELSYEMQAVSLRMH